MTRRFDSVLVANRGEIAVRVLKSARDAGYRTIAVYSEADAGAPHVALADEAVLIGPAPVKESYLDPQRILDAAARTGAQAIHPGYGFLSENTDFAGACEAAGIVFIGPSAEAIDLMGNKAAAKRRMLDADVPCIPGYQDPDQSDEALIAAATHIGVPIMVKAAAGGGGRGMRLVEALDDLPSALSAARSEAENAFGSGELILEKAVMEPRHVEVQVFGDSHGNCVHFGERDCSVQRRHQKVVEEAPCPVMTDSLREAMGGAAVAAAKSIDYVGAGTVEFLLDGDGNFYFLEMNTRLQVEHPVTECITGLDLVNLQLRIAQGEALPMTQEEVSLSGHAIEVRLYAEDTVNDFLPASGVAQQWLPPEGEGIRVDHGLLSGQTVSPFYDPMIAKIIASGPDRETARRRLVRALRDTVIFGVATNRQFLIDVLERNRFASGEATTAFIAQEFPEGVLAPVPDSEHLACTALLQFLQARGESAGSQLGHDPLLMEATGARALPSRFRYAVGNEDTNVSVQPLGDGVYAVNVANEDGAEGDGDGDDAAEIGSLELRVVHDDLEGRLRVSVDGVQKTVRYAYPARATVEVQLSGVAVTLVNNLAFSSAELEGAGSGAVLAPMHGNVLAVNVSVGDSVTEGQELAVMEAMKMEHRLLAEIDGVVTAIHGAEGEQIAAGALVLEIEASDAG